MASRIEERQRRERTSKQLIFRRTVCLMIIFGVLAFIPLGWKLWDIAIVHHEEYQMRQLNQSTRDVEVRSNRGTIRDTNGNVLAMSATVYNLILSPLDLVNSIDQRKFKNEDGVLDEAAYNAAIQERRDLITDKICSVLELDRESVVKRMDRTNSQYEIIKKNIEGEQAEQLQAFIAENRLGYSLIMTPTTKRYYPFSSVASRSRRTESPSCAGR